MNKAERDELDAKVLAAINGGAHRLSALEDALNLKWDGGVPPRRQIDRALQRLRKGGEADYATASGWHST